MAQRRMLDTNMINSDEFSTLSQAAQLLYIHLNMTADDDGLIGNPAKLMRSLLIRKQHLDTLVEKGYVIRFDSGVVAIRHWHQHNYIRSDRYVKTRYISELSQLKLRADSTYDILDFTEETGIFGQPNDVISQAQCSVGKDSIGKDSIVQCSVGNVSIFEKSEEENKTVENTEQTTNEQTTNEQTTTEQSTKDKNDDFFDFEEINCESSNITSMAEFTMLNNSHELSQYMKTLTDKQKDRYKSFLLNLYIYLAVNVIKIDAPAFIKYNEERLWLGRGGESVITNYKKYVDAWVKRDFGLKSPK
ncbi:MAG: hypothetical protein J6D20_08895 [Clostridia bacterium]|nr:hypothetical protein [Clostridia bacterium]